MLVLTWQAAVEGALSSLSNLAEDCPEVRQAAGAAGAVQILATCLKNATIGEQDIHLRYLNSLSPFAR